MRTPYTQPATSSPSTPSTGLGLYASKEYDSKLFGWIGLAVFLHAAIVVLLAAVIQLMAFFGFKIPLFTTQMKQPDIEFVLVDNQPEQAPRRPTNRRAERNTRSGGKQVANRPVQISQQAAGSPANKATPRPAVAPQPKANAAPPSRSPARSQSKPQQQPRQSQQVAQRPAAPTPRQTSSPSPAPSPTPAPTPPAPKLPKPTQLASASPSLPPNPIAPTIRTPAPKNPTANMGGGPVAKTMGGGSASGSSAGGGSASGSPSSSFIGGSPSRGSGNPGSAGSSAGGGGGNSGRGSYNQSGSPGGGGGRDGVDAMAEPDFGPYIAELQRRIRRNWAPPVEDRSKRVVALFKVSRDGRLLSLRLQQSSGSPAADQAALAAVRASAPFKQLPPNYRGSDIDVQFIFDYEIYGHGSAQRR